VGIRVLDKSLKAVRSRRSLHVRVRSSEPVTVRLTARAKHTKLASGTARLKKGGTKRLYLKLTRAGLKLARKSDQLRVTLSARASSAAGSSSSRGSWKLSD
jgi:hypothetical protein